MASTDPTQAQGRGSGKLILFGEHAVVWGATALVTSLPEGADATITHGTTPRSLLTLTHAGEQLARLSPDPLAGPLERSIAALLDTFAITHPLDIHVTLHVPPGAGLGSSAALATAIARALCAWTGLPDTSLLVAEAVATSEGIFHSSASGIDQAAALGSGLMRFIKGDVPTPLHDIPPMEIAICQAAPGASTATMVMGVTARRHNAPQRYDQVAALISTIVEDAIHALRCKDRASLGALMDFNHGLLCAMGVSTQALDSACHIAREAGALGAKLTGAGGGGCIYAVGEDEAHTTTIIHAWRRHGLQAFSATIGDNAR